jgi:hypothetical protein
MKKAIEEKIKKDSEKTPKTSENTTKVYKEENVTMGKSKSLKEPEKKIEKIENKAVKSREHICYMDCIDAYGIDQARKEECFEKCYGKFIKQKKKVK